MTGAVIYVTKSAISAKIVRRKNKVDKREMDREEELEVEEITPIYQQ
jgi:hypothetical protein